MFQRFSLVCFRIANWLWFPLSLKTHSLKSVNCNSMRSLLPISARTDQAQTMLVLATWVVSLSANPAKPVAITEKCGGTSFTSILSSPWHTLITIQSCATQMDSAAPVLPALPDGTVNRKEDAFWMRSITIVPSGCKHVKASQSLFRLLWTIGDYFSCCTFTTTLSKKKSWKLLIHLTLKFNLFFHERAWYCSKNRRARLYIHWANECLWALWLAVWISAGWYFQACWHVNTRSLNSAQKACFFACTLHSTLVYTIAAMYAPSWVVTLKRCRLKEYYTS